MISSSDSRSNVRIINDSQESEAASFIRRTSTHVFMFSVFIFLHLRLGVCCKGEEDGQGQVGMIYVALSGRLEIPVFLDNWTELLLTYESKL